MVWVRLTHNPRFCIVGAHTAAPMPAASSSPPTAPRYPMHQVLYTSLHVLLYKIMYELLHDTLHRLLPDVLYELLYTPRDVAWHRPYRVTSLIRKCFLL